MLKNSTLLEYDHVFQIFFVAFKYDLTKNTSNKIITPENVPQTFKLMLCSMVE
jgi:hypothetical protein